MAFVKGQIKRCYEQRAALKKEMAQWYEKGTGKRFPQRAELDRLQLAFSELDIRYQRQWAAQN
ncbi:hypothetical protein [Magnetococcus sp. PR-3]|uniref:hypothetical protein n=1 Tax=Magnetococcus sp. PR-3 TaxID=3120355 RepID=UPI002FCDF705